MPRYARVLALAVASALGAAQEAAVSGPSFVIAGGEALVAGVRGPGGAAYNLEATTPAGLRSGALAGDPKVAVFVVVPDASGASVAAAADGGRLRSLSALVESLPSATLPHVHASGSGVDPAFFGPPGAEGAVPLKEAAAAVKSHFSRGGGEALRLTAVAPSLEDVDARLDELRAAAAAAAGDDYVLVVSATAPPNRGPRARLSPLRRLEAAAAAAKDGVRMTPDILTGILVGGLFVVVALIGLTCISSIQTPSEYSHTGPPSMKEF
jgi:hypothetical protein